MDNRFLVKSILFFSSLHKLDSVICYDLQQLEMSLKLKSLRLSKDLPKDLFHVLCRQVYSFFIFSLLAEKYRLKYIIVTNFKIVCSTIAKGL